MDTTRRSFIKNAGLATGLMATGLPDIVKGAEMPKAMKKEKNIKITRVNSNFEREPLTPYRFKGSAITQAWQVVAWMESESGIGKAGIGTQGVLWSDSKVFHGHSENGGNALMYAMSERALQIIKGQTFTNPVELLDNILEEVLAYGRKVTGNPNLRKTFALNSLVAVDNAAWLLYAAENGLSTFDELVPEAFKPGLSHRHKAVAGIPSYAVGTRVEELKSAAEAGYFIMKLKTGASGTQKEMIEKDMQFLTDLHKAIGHFETPHTKSGRIPYYFDANGRYEKKETLLRFLDRAEKIGALDQIAVVEEPFPEENEDFVGDVGVRIAADESAHTVEDAAKRIELGYQAIAVKAIAKTLSMTMKITQLAYEKNVPCFCADLTVNPILVEWNKNIAARLSPFPGMDIGLQEANGHQYYKRWEQMRKYHANPEATWANTKEGVYPIDESFFKSSGGIFHQPAHYVEMVKED